MCTMNIREEDKLDAAMFYYKQLGGAVVHVYPYLLLVHVVMANAVQSEAQGTSKNKQSI